MWFVSSTKRGVFSGTETRRESANWAIPENKFEDYSYSVIAAFTWELPKPRRSKWSECVLSLGDIRLEEEERERECARLFCSFISCWLQRRDTFLRVHCERTLRRCCAFGSVYSWAAHYPKHLLFASILRVFRLCRSVRTCFCVALLGRYFAVTFHKVQCSWPQNHLLFRCNWNGIYFLEGVNLSALIGECWSRVKISELCQLWVGATVTAEEWMKVLCGNVWQSLIYSLVVIINDNLHELCCVSAGLIMI